MRLRWTSCCLEATASTSQLKISTLGDNSGQMQKGLTCSSLTLIDMLPCNLHTALHMADLFGCGVHRLSGRAGSATIAKSTGSHRWNFALWLAISHHWPSITRTPETHAEHDITGSSARPPASVTH